LAYFRLSFWQIKQNQKDVGNGFSDDEGAAASTDGRSASQSTDNTNTSSSATASLQDRPSIGDLDNWDSEDEAKGDVDSQKDLFVMQDSLREVATPGTPVPTHAHKLFKEAEQHTPPLLTEENVPNYADVVS